VLHDPDLAEAILDRVLERVRVIEMRGSSYRTRHLEGRKIVPQGARTRLEVNLEGRPGPGERGPSSLSYASGMGVRISGNQQSEYLEPALHDKRCQTPREGYSFGGLALERRGKQVESPDARGALAKWGVCVPPVSAANLDQSTFALDMVVPLLVGY
jgi:hypothetical protein